MPEAISQLTGDLPMERFPFLQSLLASTSNPVAIKDLESRYVVVNKGVEDLFGLPRKEIQGKCDNELLPAELAAQLRENDRRVFAERQQLIFDEEIHIGSEVRFFCTTKSPLYGRDNELIGLVINAYDVTEEKANEKRLRETLHILQSIMQSTDDLVSIVNAQFAYKFINPAMDAFLKSSFGVDTENIIGKHLRDIKLPEDVFNYVQASFETVKETRARVEGKFSHNGRHYTLLFIPELDINENVKNIISVCKEVTTEYQQSEMKSMFINMARHELKNPLTVLKGYHQVAMRTLQEKRYDESEAFLEKCTGQIDKITGMLNDMLNLDNMGHNIQLQLSRFNIRELMTPLILYCRSLSEKHQLAVMQCDNVFVTADKTKLEQVLHNLVSNAVKYSMPATSIQLCITEKDGKLQISVRDSGTGIPDAEKHRVFEPYYRQINHRTKEGLGMGLYVVRQIVTLHNGTIWIEDGEGGKGCVFKVQMPVSQTNNLN